jgi:hypothetical protein
MKRKGPIFFVAGIVIILGISTFLLLRKLSEPAKPGKLRVGLLPDSVSALLYTGCGDLCKEA